MHQTVLISTLGAEPQVVTLALDSLLAMGIIIQRVDVIHTNPTHEPIRSALERLHTVFLKERHYGDMVYVPYPLAGEKGILDDVVSTEDIEYAFNSLYTLIRHHKQSGNTIHMCIAGGRKTTTVFALSVANALFEITDSIWHLVSESSVIESKAMHAVHGVELVPVVFLHPTRMADFDKAHTQVFLNTILTDVEREIITLIVREGLTNQNVANRLYKSVKTVANQLTTIYDKLRLHYELPKSPDRATVIVMLSKYM